MCFTKKLILIINIFSILFGEGFSFRGRSTDKLLGRPIPLAFSHAITNNYDILPSQINPQRGSYMIIVPDEIMTYIDNFVTFKKSQGFDVYVIPLTQAGESADDIKATITNKLNDDPMLEYVLLIGDVDGFAALPSFYYGPENDVSDQVYTYIQGDDYFPDVYIGRFSVDSFSDVAVMIAKTIKYARDPLAYNSDWLDRGLIVAGNYSNTYPIPITPKWTSYWLRDELLDYGYSQIDTVFFPPIQQGAPYIISSIDNGVGIVNYRGWGDANGWHYPEFHVEDVNDLNNGWLTPVFMSYVCNSNDFANNVDPCLAEAVLRGGTPTVPKGGVAFIGPSDLHTSTKYNNVINAYMYDAMLNHDVFELGQAMQAGQSGLLREFPAQNGPGEAQEFYAHVYNILGDPSLQIYVDTPNQFIINIENVNADGLIDLTLTNTSGDFINDAVISIMNDGEILGKGLSDDQGRFLMSVNVSSISQLDVYANKGGFIQGYSSVAVQSDNSQLSVSSLTIENEQENGKIILGELTNFILELKNHSGSSIEAFSGEINFSEEVEPNSFSVDIPAISSGASESLPAIEFRAYSPSMGHAIKGELMDQNGSKISEFVLEIELPVFDISFENDFSSNSGFDPSLSIKNFSNAAYSNIWLEISSLSDGATVTQKSTSDELSNFHPFQTFSHGTNYNIEIGDVSYGSSLTFLVGFKKSGRHIFSQEISILIEPVSENVPVAPSNYGYWAYDNTDIGFSQSPTFDWVELDPNHGGISGIHYQLDDDDHIEIGLPFTFKYHGIYYNNITVSSNGWSSFEPCYIDYFWNMSIPMYMGPKAMLAPFSDDLETIDSDSDGEIDVWINVYTWYDEENGRFIIEWSRALNGYDEETEETFEIILYDQSSMPTESGDGVIDFLYLEINDVDVTKNYSTVGIESPSKNYGIQYVFNNVYAPGAAQLVNNRAIRFTTEAPENYISPLKVDEIMNPLQFTLGPTYPNPFNPVTRIEYKLPEDDWVQILIFDILGKQISTLVNRNQNAGNYSIIWDGTNNLGSRMSSGTYFAVMKYQKMVRSQKLLYLK